MLEENPEYFHHLSGAVDRWAREYGGRAPIIKIDSSRIDYESDNVGKEMLAREVNSWISYYAHQNRLSDFGHEPWIPDFIMESKGQILDDPPPGLSSRSRRLRGP